MKIKMRYYLRPTGMSQKRKTAKEVGEKGEELNIWTSVYNNSNIIQNRKKCGNKASFNIRVNKQNMHTTQRNLIWKKRNFYT